MSPQDANEHFLSLGVQYYTAARAAVLARLSPVCGNLYHHAIEMLVKAHLSQRRSLEDLSRRPFGHDLCALWNAFKADFPTSGLEEFDDTIATLAAFETIRYPDAIIKKGAEINVMWCPGPVSSAYAPGTTPPPRYQIVVTDIDRLVERIFKVSSRNPVFFTGGMNHYARDAITCDNPVWRGWFPPQEEVMSEEKKMPESFRAYEDGKHRRYGLLFAVNGGAFAIAKLFADGKAAAVLGNLTLRQLSFGMISFTIVMIVDIFMFGEKMRTAYLPDDFGWQGKTVLLLIGILICAGWFLVA